ncbi:MAG: hypothetical protein INQ03_13765 [Candidatus Heimdallarchaeota archaeon]|nr:hypothetical protein [Candidatus Heimdallarchaeota archaeon]
MRKQSIFFFLIVLMLIPSMLYLQNLQDTGTEDTQTDQSITTDPILQYPEKDMNNHRTAFPIQNETTETTQTEHTDTRSNDLDFSSLPQRSLGLDTVDYKQADNSIYSNWKQGKTVTVDNSFNSEVTDAYINNIDNGIYGTTLSDDVFFNNFRGSYENDGTDFIISMHDNSESAGITDFFLVEIEYEYASSFNVHVVASADYTQGAKTYSSLGNFYIYPVKNGVSDTTDYISDNDGTIDDYITLDSSFADGNKLIFWVEVWWTTSSSNVEHICNFRFDKFAIEETVTSQLRSEYTYNSYNSITHRLQIENFGYGNEITVYKPANWDYGSISTEATVSDSTNTVITGTVPITYTVTYSQKNHYFLAVEDITEYESTCLDYECGTSSWINRVSTAGNNGMDSTTIVSDIVSEGSYALRLEENGGWGQTSMPIEDFEEGEYYATFDFYIVSYDSGSFSIRGFPTAFAFSDYSTERWYTASMLIDISYWVKYSTMPEYSFINIVLDPATNAVVIFDNFHFFRVSAREEYTDVNEMEFKAQFVSFDNIEFPVIQNTEVNMLIRERSSFVDVYEETIVTDNQGIASTKIGLDLLHNREYDVLWYDVNSKFSRNYETKDNPYYWQDLSIWSCASGCTSYSESLDTDNGIITLSYTANNVNQYFQQVISSEIGLITDWDFYTFEFRSTDTTSPLELDKLYSYDAPYTGAYMGDQVDLQFDANERIRYTTPITEFAGWDTVFRTNGYTMAYIRMQFIGTPSASVQYYIYDSHFIKAQHSYFTPVSASEKIWSFGNDKTGEPLYFDFSEGSTADKYLWGYYDENIVDGSFYREYGGDYFYTYFPYKLNAYYYPTFYTETPVYDLTGYEYIDIRIYVDEVPNTANRYTFYWCWDRTDFWGNVASTSIDTDKTGWFNLRIPIHSTIIDSYADSIEIMRFTVSSNGASNFVDLDFYMDYINIVDQTYHNTAWEDEDTSDINLEFEGKTQQDSYRFQSPAYITGNGFISCYTTSAYGGCNSKAPEYFPFTYIPEVDQMEIKFRSNIAGSYRMQWNLDTGSDITTFTYTTANVWQIATRGMQNIQGDELTGGSPLQIIGNNLAGTKYVDVEYVRFKKNIQPFLYETDSYFQFYSEFNDQAYYYQIDGKYGIAYDLDIIQKNLDVGSHEIQYQVIKDLSNHRLDLGSVWFYDTYTVYESDLASITIIDQSNNFLEPRQFKIKVDTVRIYSDTFYWSDTSTAKSIEILDLFDNQLYYSASVSYERFIDIVLTLYSVKIVNIQPQSIHFTITRDAKTYSEWVLPNEIVSYKLETATYNFEIEYSTVTGDFAQAIPTGTTVNFNYAVTSDTALSVTGDTITDVYDNTLALIQDITDLDSSITTQFTTQTNTLQLEFNAQNQDLTFILDNSSLIVDTLSSNFTAILADTLNLMNLMGNLDLNLQSNFTNILSDTFNIFGSIENLDLNLESNFTAILADTLNILGDLTLLDSSIDAGFVDVLADTVSIIGDVSILDSSIASNFTFLMSETVNLFGNLDLSLESNFSAIFADTLSIIGDLTLIDSSLASNFTQILSDTFSIIGDLTLIDSNIDAGFVEMSTDLLQIITDVANINVTTQILSLLSNVTNIAELLVLQDVNLLSNFTSIANILASQDVFLLSNFTNIINLMSTSFTATNSFINLISENMNLNFTATNSIIEMVSSWMEANFTVTNSAIDFLSSAINGDFSILNSNLEGNFTILSNLINVLNSSFSGDIDIVTNLLQILQSDISANFTIFNADMLQIITDVANINVTAQIVEIMANVTNIGELLVLQDLYLFSNFTSIVNLLASQDVFLLSNFTNIVNLMASNFTATNSFISLISQNMNLNFTATNSIIEMVSSWMEANFTVTNSALYFLENFVASNFTALNSHLEGNFTIVTNMLLALNTTFSGDIDIVTDMLLILESEISANFTSAMTLIDLTNSSQVTLLVENYNSILQAQIFAKEYMSVLRIERNDFTVSDTYVSINVQTNWKNQTIDVYVNGTLAYSGIETETIVIQLNESPGTFNVTIAIFDIRLTKWVVIVPTSDTLVHFVLTNELGTGLDFNTAKIEINGTALYAQAKYFDAGTFLNITVRSWAGDLILSFNATVSESEQEVVIALPIYEIEFKNGYDFDVLLTLTSITNANFTVNRVIPSNSSIFVEMFDSTFLTSYEPIATASYTNNTHEVSYSKFTETIAFRKTLKAVNVKFNMKAISLDIAQPNWFDRNVAPILMAMFGTVSALGLALALVFFGMRQFGSDAVKENILKPTLKTVGVDVSDEGKVEIDELDDFLKKRKFK